jgi:septal ring factor EnvC (AmiA/AmiB activator)
MNLPSIPTDNLYKFCAVSGVVLLLFGATYPVQKLFDTQNNLDQVRTEEKILSAQIADLREDFQRLNSDLESLDKDTTAAEANPGAADVPSLRARSAAAGTTLSAVKTQGRHLAIINIRQQGNFEHLTHLIQRLWLYLAAAAIFMLGGLQLAFFGFRRWYYRVQKPADDLLQRQIRENIS